MNMGEPIDWVLRPPSLIGVRSAFALYVIGDSMSPAFEQGDIVVVHPGRPVIPGSYCVVELTPTGEGENPKAYLKRVVKRGPDKITVEQLNPPKRLTFHIADIRAIYRVLALKDVLGQ